MRTESIQSQPYLSSLRSYNLQASQVVLIFSNERSERPKGTQKSVREWGVIPEITRGNDGTQKFDGTLGCRGVGVTPWCNHFLSKMDTRGYFGTFSRIAHVPYAVIHWRRKWNWKCRFEFWALSRLFDKQTYEIGLAVPFKIADFVINLAWSDS